LTLWGKCWNSRRSRPRAWFTWTATRTYGELSESEQYSFAIELPESIGAEERDSIYHQVTEGLEGIRKENHALMIKLVAQLVLAKVRLFQHERAD
jgi:hypothetical protein